jgi:SAM-dependent methyltransferase
MSQSGRAGAEVPYAQRMIERRERLRAAGHDPSLCMHLGYWHEPSQANPADVADFSAAQARLDQRLLDLADLCAGTIVLDVGCGLGGTLLAVDARIGDASTRLLGVNAGPAQLAVALREAAPQLRSPTAFLRADACALPLSAASVERVLAVECVFHFASRRHFLAQAARVLVPGGRLVLSDFVPSASFSLGEEERRLLELGHGSWPDPGCEHGSCTSLAAELGFDSLHCEDATAQVLPSFAGLLARLRQDPRVLDRLEPVDAAGAVLGRLLAEGRLRMELCVLGRVPVR